MRNGTEQPLYKKLIADLKQLIDKGTYKKGDLLPSENDLCKTYNTTRPTVRQALSDLLNAGYITRQQGKGSIVAEPKKGLGILSVSGFTAGVGGKNLKTELLDKPQKRDWDADFFYDLSDEELKAGSIYFSRLRYINDLPVLFEETFIANVGLPRFTARNLENRSLFKTLLENYQVEVKEGEQKIWAIGADEKIGKLLNLQQGTPIVHMKRKLITNKRNLNIYSWLYSNTEEYYLHENF
ncbi:GntR family transcriptional regulator [Mucilaginibacter limnophilus]|uniref:GntR family transcriptional regulator n=1 Tax=Mucilaginibacter limnophilus TaxID=1932778 RepID=A0A437MWM3_9SPHI|nr:GntR family transcriptional regulator [Mucilaginibacter limnophilus]RVU02053.1 GntR family transcriptional regulator [Mucilaginibacter limnophilus]